MTRQQWARVKADPAYHARIKARDTERRAKYREQYNAYHREYQRKLYEQKKHEPEYKAQLKVKSERYVAKKLATDPEGYKRQLRRARLARYAKDPEKYRAWMRQHYERNKDKYRERHREWHRKNWFEIKMRAISRAETKETTLLCEKGCGRKTLSDTGVCQACRTTACRKCREPLIMKYLGQRLHTKCLPKE